MIERLKSRVYKTLRWSEKYTKTDMVYLVGGGIWLTSGQVLTTTIGFGASVAFAYFLPKDAYGNYKYILSVFAIFSAFTLTGLGTAIIQSVARGFDGALQQGLRLSVRWSIPAVTGAALGAGYYAYNNNHFLAFALVVVAIAIPLLASFGLYAAYLNGKKDFRRLSIYNLIDNATPTLLVVGALLLTTNVSILIGIYFGVSAALGYIFYRLTIRAHKPKNDPDVTLEKYSIKLSALNVISILTTHVDKVIVFTTLGSVQLAVYSFATAFPDQIRALVKLLNTLMIPKIAGLAPGARLALKGKVMRLFALLVLITLSYYLAAPFLYSIFFPKYLEAVYYSRILALVILSSVALIPVSIFIAQKQEDKLAKASIGGSVLQLVLLYPAAHFWGITGVCIARVLGSYVIAAIAFMLLENNRK